MIWKTVCLSNVLLRWLAFLRPRKMFGIFPTPPDNQLGLLSSAPSNWEATYTPDSPRPDTCQNYCIQLNLLWSPSILSWTDPIQSGVETPPAHISHAPWKAHEREWITRRGHPQLRAPFRCNCNKSHLQMSIIHFSIHCSRRLDLFTMDSWDHPRIVSKKRSIAC